jgi:hypothetical protein
VTTQPPRPEPQLRARSWGDARLRVAQFLANLWRINNEQTAYAVAADVDAIPALWSGPRRHGGPAIGPSAPIWPAPSAAPPTFRRRSLGSTLLGRMSWPGPGCRRTGRH